MSKTSFYRSLRELTQEGSASYIKKLRAGASEAPAPTPAPPVHADLASLTAALGSMIQAQQQQAELIQRLLQGQQAVQSGGDVALAPRAPEPEPEWTPPEYSNTSIINISDLHAPYEHPDALAFLDALNNAYQFERAVCTGDETDGHAISFHTSNPNLPSAGLETERARETMARLHGIFPVMDLMNSNHGSLIYRRQQDGGLPDQAMQSYRGFLFGEKRKDGSTYFPGNAGAKWRWHDNLSIVLPNGEEVLFVHGYATNVKLAVQKAGMSIVQGHYHSEFDAVALQGTRGQARFGITGGCLIDDNSYAFAYGKNFVKRPIIACSGILDGQPVQFKMPLDNRGRWTGRLPFGILPQMAA